ncbi:MAG: hypothetical protein ABW123_08785, partial [Cystobacter sp.]
MSPPLRTLFSFVCAAVLLGGCKDKPEDGLSPDRTLEKLRLEVDRTNKGGAPAAPPDAPADPRAELADLAAAQESDSPKPLELASSKPVRVDTLELQPSGLESMHSLRGAGKVALTTSDLFVRVKLEARNTGARPVDVTLSAAKLVDAEGQEHPLPRDAQTVGGTRRLDHTWEPGQSESLVLVFEVPLAAVTPGLVLAIPSRGGQDARIPLQ